MILYFHCARDFVQGIGDSHDELRDANPSAEAPGLEVSQASNGVVQMCEERE
jgi:hypothetical protein